ncbi:hypothetical protein ACFOLA_02190 [Salinicoccus hispanicus]|nr:hypothetical protein [Salinicoccus hispanicus]
MGYANSRGAIWKHVDSEDKLMSQINTASQRKTKR